MLSNLITIGDLDLFCFFDAFHLGKIVSVRIMTDKENGRSKGFGFVSYDNQNSAEMAIKVINGKQALGKRLKVELKKGGMGPPHIPTATPPRERHTSSHKG
jgi:RNA recognition motif-containing protein